MRSTQQPTSSCFTPKPPAPSSTLPHPCLLWGTVAEWCARQRRQHSGGRGSIQPGSSRADASNCSRQQTHIRQEESDTHTHTHTRGVTITKNCNCGGSQRSRKVKLEPKAQPKQQQQQQQQHGELRRRVCVGKNGAAICFTHVLHDRPRAMNTHTHLLLTLPFFGPERIRHERGYGRI